VILDRIKEVEMGGSSPRTRTGARGPAIWWICAAAALAAIAVTASGARASSQEVSGQRLDALTAEVRLLGRSIDRSAALMVRAHITVQLAASHRHAADLLSAEREQLLRDISGVVADRAKSDGTARELEIQIASYPQSTLLSLWRQSLQVARAEAEKAAALEDQYRQRAAQLDASLQADRARLNELMKQLAEIDRTLNR
jgi:hypothetical protein